jgi:amino acid permease
MLMTKTQFGLGVLTMPIAFDALGMIPGVILLCFMAALTTWTGHIVGTLKLAHPGVYNIGDASAVMFGRIGREFFSVAFILCKCY